MNLSKGKTEAVVHYRGPNAAQLRRARFLEHFSYLEVPGQESLRIVTQYVHLGISFAQDCDIKADVNTKIGKATAAYRSLHRPLFGNKRIPIAIRLKLLESLVLPILFYGAGSWPLLPVQLSSRLSAAITRWQRQIIGDGYWKAGSLSDQALRAHWKLPELALRLAKHRLLFLLQLRHHGPAILWECLTAEDGSAASSWLAAVRQALRWFYTMQHDAKLPDLTCDNIVKWALEAPATMPKSIRRAVHRHLMQEFEAHQVVQAHRDLKSMCLRYGVVFENINVPSTSPLSTFDCSECCKSFSIVQGLNAHRWKQHQTISIERQFVFSSTCLCCHRGFWTAQRLQQHLRYSRRFENGCFSWIQTHFEPQSTSTPIALPEFFKGQFRLPWTHACGPEPEPPRALWAIQHDKAWAAWTSDWQKAGFPEDLSAEICTSVHDAMNGAIPTWIADGAHANGLAFQWSSLIDNFEEPHDPLRSMHAMWAFGLWGRTCMYEEISQIEDPDIQISVEQQYLSMLDDLPVSSLLDRLEKLHRATPFCAEKAFVPILSSPQSREGH